MDNKIERFLKKANFDVEKFYYFNNAVVKEVVVNKKTNEWTIKLTIDNMLPIEIYKELKNSSKTIKEASNINFIFTFVFFLIFP